jgi:DNA (cytosine-5)-methyltransferase 1
MNNKSTEIGNTAAIECLAVARQYHSQAAIASHLGVSERQVRRWEARESNPPQYVSMALQRLLPFHPSEQSNAEFKFIDLFAGIGGIRLAFEGIGGECVFTSEWDAYAQRTYMANFGGQHPINGDITKIWARR